MKSHNVLIVLIFFNISIAASAQSFGLKGGVNLSNMLVRRYNQTYSKNLTINTGFNAGLIYDYSLNDNLLIESGALLASCGFNFSEIGLSEKLDLLYIVIPYNGKYYFGKGDTRFYCLLGPYLGFGVSGKEKSTGIVSGRSVSDVTNISWGKNGDGFRRLDFGLTFGAGVRSKSLEIGISYNLGIDNISMDQSNSMNIKNRVLSISSAYVFNKIKNNTSTAQ